MATRRSNCGILAREWESNVRIVYIPGATRQAGLGLN
jgi:hypothetical protein